jgi:ATP-dependent Clp protease ATP-binding subunit ClpA
LKVFFDLPENRLFVPRGGKFKLEGELVRSTFSKPENALLKGLRMRIIGQEKAMSTIVPWVQMHQAGLSPEGRPAGVFLMLGPTGTGKTRTVEALAEVLHGSHRHMLKIDCGEFHLEHEVAKLVGAPPGYLGHRETHPVLTQPRLTAVTSRHSDLSILLFDEIEKAAPSLTRLLLGVLDKGVLRLGDNTVVNFERTMIFMTSNLGAAGMMKTLDTGFGFRPDGPIDENGRSRELENIAMAAVRRHFSPEFVNRLDATITYEPLGSEVLARILDLQLDELQGHINKRLGDGGFQLYVAKEGRKWLLSRGTSVQYGAREMKRTLNRHLMQPLAEMVANGDVPAGGEVRAEYSKKHDRLVLKAA